MIFPQNNWFKKTFFASLWLCAFFCHMGCSYMGEIANPGSKSKLTAENFLKIQAGMNHQEVSLILGPPTEWKGSYELGIRSMEWREGVKSISVSIDNNGNVMTFTAGGSAAKTQSGLN